jgi:hypothetical protein
MDTSVISNDSGIRRSEERGNLTGSEDQKEPQ